MSFYEFVVVEHYPDGGVWKHFYPSLEHATWAVGEMHAAHPARQYEIHPMPAEGATS